MRSRPVYEPPGLANSHAIACHARASLAHFEFFAGFFSSQKWWSLSVKLRTLVCPSRSVQVVMSPKTATVRPMPLLSRFRGLLTEVLAAHSGTLCFRTRSHALSNPVATAAWERTVFAAFAKVSGL